MSLRAFLPALVLCLWGLGLAPLARAQGTAEAKVTLQLTLSATQIPESGKIATLRFATKDLVDFLVELFPEFEDQRVEVVTRRTIGTDPDGDVAPIFADTVVKVDGLIDEDASNALQDLDAIDLPDLSDNIAESEKENGDNEVVSTQQIELEGWELLVGSLDADEIGFALAMTGTQTSSQKAVIEANEVTGYLFNSREEEITGAMSLRASGDDVPGGTLLVPGLASGSIKSAKEKAIPPL
jgi:hypothetical protein